MSISHPWLRRLAPVDSPALRLVCLPHAGGGASAYRDWATWLPAEVEVCAVQLPGREDRRGEPMPDTLAEAAAHVAEALESLADRPHVLFGHSFGAQLSFEVALRQERGLARAPIAVFLSGSRPPHRIPEREQLHRLDDPELLAAIKRYGGVPEAIRASPEYFAAFAPVLRRDFRLVEVHEPEDQAQIAAPVVALGGRDDRYVPLASLLGWQARASGLFSARAFPGGHFFLHDPRSGLVADLAQRLSRMVSRECALS